MRKPLLTETLLAAALLLAAPLPALAQMPAQQQHHAQPSAGAAPQQDPSPAQPGPGMMNPANPGQGMMGPGMMGQGMMGQAMPGGMGMGMMDGPMMAHMMHMHPEMMSMMQGHMGRGHMAMHSMGRGHMDKGHGGMHHMGQGYMGQGYMGRHHGDRHGGAGSRMMMAPQGGNLAAGVVEPMQHLSVDDVRHFFEHRLAQIGNARLKVGKVEREGEDSIVAEIVTQDDSLVDRLEVDRHSGEISRKP